VGVNNVIILILILILISTITNNITTIVSSLPKRSCRRPIIAHATPAPAHPEAPVPNSSRPPARSPRAVGEDRPKEHNIHKMVSLALVTSLHKEMKVPGLVAGVAQRR
jgi:hypothetical protein